MALIATCPSCRQSYQVGEQFAGKTARCQACGQPFVVPAAPAADPLAAAAAMQSSLGALPGGGSSYASTAQASDPLGRGLPGHRAAAYTSASAGPSFGTGGNLSAGEPVEWAIKPGITCSILGVGGFLLPLLGVQFKILALLGPAAPIVAGVLALAGAVLLFLGLKDNLLKALPAAGAVLVFAGGAFALSASLENANNQQLNALGQPLPPPGRNGPNPPPPAPAGQVAPPLPPGQPQPAAGQPGNPQQPQPQPQPQPQAERPAEQRRQFAAGDPLDPAAELPRLTLDAPPAALPILPAFQENEFLTAGSLRGEPAFQDLAPAGCWLVGLRVVQSKNWGGAICGIQPIYQFEGHYGSGKYCGVPGGVKQVVLLARPGYAVSGLRVHVGLALNSLQLEFRQVEGEGMVADGAYTSEWVGCEGGGLQPLLDAQGQPIVGVRATADKDLNGLQLLIAPK